MFGFGEEVRQALSLQGVLREFSKDEVSRALKRIKAE